MEGILPFSEQKIIHFCCILYRFLAATEWRPPKKHRYDLPFATNTESFYDFVTQAGVLLFLHKDEKVDVDL